jgi:drug/metabolite transporter (DMT)-like permease
MLAKTKSEKTKGIIALILLAAIFASMGIFVRFLQGDFTILQQTYLRIFIAAVLGTIVFAKDIHLTKIFKISKKDWALLLLRAISLYVLAVTLVSYAYTVGKYSNVSFIQDIPFTAILGFILLKEKITKPKILYITVGFLGVILISVKDYSNLFSWGHAELFSLISGFFFAFSYIARRWQSNVLNNKEIAVYIFYIATVLLVLTSVIFGEGIPHSSWNSTILLILLGAGAFNVANLFLTNYGFEKVEAVIASNILGLETLFAVVIAIFLFHELPSIKELIGGLLIVFSVYKMNKLA